MSNGSDRGTALFIAGSGTAPSSSNVGVQFTASEVTVVGGLAGFAGVGAESGGEPTAVGIFTPSTFEIGGSFGFTWCWAVLSIPTATSVDGTITADPPLPFALTFSLLSGGSGSYTLPANATSGSFSLPFSGSNRSDIDLRSLKAPRTSPGSPG